jgi:hypothetical protein
MNQRGQATRIEEAAIGHTELLARTTCASSLFAHESTRVQIIAKRAPSTAENIDVQRVGDDVSISCRSKVLPARYTAGAP